MTAAPRDRTRPRPRTVRWGDLCVAAIGLLIAAALFAGSAAMEVRGHTVPGPRFFPILVGVLLSVTSGYLLLRAAIPAKRIPEHEELEPDVSRDLLADVSHADTQLLRLERERADPGSGGRGAGDPGSGARGAGVRGSGDPGSGDRGSRDPGSGDPSAAGDARSAIRWRPLATTAASVAGCIAVLPLLGWILSCALLFAGVAHGLGSRRVGFSLAVGLLIGSISQLVFGGLLGLALPAGVFGGIR